MVWGYGKTYCGINLMTKGVFMTLMPLKWPQDTPECRLMAYFNRSITPYILYIALYKNCVYKGFGVSYSYWKTYFWNPFDDSRGLHDPNAKQMGLWRPPRLPHSIFWSQCHTLRISFILPWNYNGMGIRVWGNQLWHPFDDSRVLKDPNASERGLRRPQEVAS